MRQKTYSALLYDDNFRAGFQNVQSENLLRISHENETCLAIARPSNGFLFEFIYAVSFRPRTVQKLVNLWIIVNLWKELSNKLHIVVRYRKKIVVIFFRQRITKSLNGNT